MSEADDVQKLRDYGWSDYQIAEAVYIIARFAFFNRVASASSRSTTSNSAG